MTEAFYILSFGLVVFRAAPFGKHVGRREKGEDLFKADRKTYKGTSRSDLDERKTKIIGK